MKKTKVVHIINNLEIGGAERVLISILKYLSTYKNMEITVISLEGHGPLETEIKKLGIEVKNFHYHLFLPLFRRIDPYFRFRLFIYCLLKRPNVIHGHLIRGEDFAKVLGGLLRVPVITTMHDTMIIPGKKQRFLNRFLTKAVGVSSAVTEHLKNVYGLPEKKVVLIPDTIEIDDFVGSKKVYNPQKPIFIYLGRLFRTKGIDFAIRGLAKLHEEFPNIEFHIYGSQVFPEDYKKWTREVKRNKWDFVKFMGSTADVPDTLRSADIFVLPSKTEGFAIAALEAAAASKPLIATRAGSIPEMLIDGENGYFVEYVSVDDIYTAGKKLLEGGKIEEFGNRSYQIVKDKFDIQKIAKMYYNLYLLVGKNVKNK